MRRYVASIAHLHRAAELQDPTKSETVKLALRRMARAKGTRQRQAVPEERSQRPGDAGAEHDREPGCARGALAAGHDDQL